MQATRYRVLLIPCVTLIVVAATALGCNGDREGAPTSSVTRSPAETASLEGVARSRGLSPDEARAALEVYVPPGGRDEYIMFTSGGHGGSVYIHGLPSMRLLKEIPVYSPDSWQGWGYGSSKSELLLDEGTFSPGSRLPRLTWGDVHHPKFSITDGDYDGEFLFVADKAAGRLAVIDLRDFFTKQIVKTPNVVGDHSHVVVGNTDYIVSSTFHPSPGGPGVYAPIEEYAERYRGAITFHRFDREAGRIRLEESFQMELPPYFQDLMASGRLVSDGWLFLNSINTSMATGGVMEGNPPFEVGASMSEMDYLHVIPWRRIEALVRQGHPDIVQRGGIPVVPLELAREKNLLYFVPETKSPHGVDVSPGGEYIVVSGKLDPHVTIFSFENIRRAIEQNDFAGTDPFGFPILDYDAMLAAYIEVGLGPLHTVFDDKGFGYTSLFLDSAIAKFSLGPPYHEGDDAFKLVDKVDIHYNIGHLQAPGTDTVRPRGRYLVALNKWVVDRHPGLGPLHPQNMQLIDISGEKMRLIGETPLIGEPHNATIIETDRLQPWPVYPPQTDPGTMEAPSPYAVRQGEEGIERTADGVHVRMVVLRSHFKPDIIRVKQGERVRIDITNVESAQDATHGFSIHGYNVTLSIDPGATQTVEFVASEAGVYPFYCTEFCSALHMEMAGWMLVEPR